MRKVRVLTTRLILTSHQAAAAVHPLAMGENIILPPGRVGSPDLDFQVRAAALLPMDARVASNSLCYAPVYERGVCCGWITTSSFLGKIYFGVLGLRLQILGVLLHSPLHIWIVPQTALGSGLVAISKLTYSACSSVHSTVRSLDLTVYIVKFSMQTVHYRMSPR